MISRESIEVVLNKYSEALTALEHNADKSGHHFVSSSEMNNLLYSLFSKLWVLILMLILKVKEYASKLHIRKNYFLF